MKTLFKIALLLVAPCLLIAYLSRRQSQAIVTDVRYRGLTQAELKRREQELNAKLVIKQDLHQGTFVVYETSEGLKVGTEDVMVRQYSDGKTLEAPQHSLRVVDINRNQRASVLNFTENIRQWENGRTNFVQGRGYVLSMIQDPKLLKEVDSVKYVFTDKTGFATLPVKAQKAMIFSHDKDKECCAQVDFLAENGKVLHARANGIQISP